MQTRQFFRYKNESSEDLTSFRFEASSKKVVCNVCRLAIDHEFICVWQFSLQNVRVCGLDSTMGYESDKFQREYLLDADSIGECLQNKSLV